MAADILIWEVSSKAATLMRLAQSEANAERSNALLKV